MYQWVNPTTGNSQMSGKAPAWYRSETGGPRVLVFEKNQLVDDTAVGVDENQRHRLRGLAFHSRASDKEMAFTASQAIATLEEKIQAIVESPAMEAYLKNPPSLAKLESTKTKSDTPSSVTDDQSKTGISNNQPAAGESADERVERLKALISVWDENRTQEAKSVLESESTEKK